MALQIVMGGVGLPRSVTARGVTSRSEVSITATVRSSKQTKGNRAIGAMRGRFWWTLRLLPITVCVAWMPLSAEAQYVPNLFPAGVPGYGRELGVTVVSRPRSLYAQRGVRIGDFLIHANLDGSTGYNSNVLGLSDGPGSAVIEVRPSLELNSDWSRDSLGASVSVDSYTYPGSGSLSHTDWTAAIGAGYTIGRSNLTVSYAHLALHESATDVGAPLSTSPIPYAVDDMRVEYPMEFGRLQIVPNFDVSLWRYGEATIGGVASDQGFRNSNEYRGGAAFSYGLSGNTSLVFTAQGFRSDFIRPQPGRPSLSSTSEIFLVGLDYQYDGVWRYLALAGLEAREFDASQFQTKIAPILRGTIIWTPTELTTVELTVLRSIENPTQAGTSGYTYTEAALQVDHEYARNLLLHARIGETVAAYLQDGGTQAALSVGVGATWLLNRHLRISADYTYTTQNDFTPQSPAGSEAGAVPIVNGYSQNLFLISVHFGI